MGENRLKLISNMKIVFFCFLPFVAADGISAKNLYEYVTISSGIRQHMQSVSQYLHIIDSGSRDVTDIIYKNISQVLAHYGPKKHLHFISKYEPQAVDFAGNQNLSADCRQYIIDLIEESKQHQHELSEYVEKALGSFIEELERIHKKFHWAESILTDIEKKVFNCGFFSETADAIDSYNCALDTLKTMEILKIDITNVVVTDALSLLSAKRKILDNLHQSLSDRFIPEFYNEKGRDRWLKIFCPND
ncbi:uncharacterized protein [Fopius arisanus]|uniref:Uncharacterized protein n=1 Tax=Fopius arisanus TaxID=64838 RepID=A0A9R1U396_9HYME|nr:PREDICTED: uncharacterized protein LOC105269102 [Fopius arisanus]